MITKERFAELWHKYCVYYFVISKEPKLVEECSPRLAKYLIDAANGVKKDSGLIIDTK